jgi:hypothetical protein
MAGVDGYFATRVPDEKAFVFNGEAERDPEANFAPSGGDGHSREENFVCAQRGREVSAVDFRLRLRELKLD